MFYHIFDEAQIESVNCFSTQKESLVISCLCALKIRHKMKYLEMRKV